MWLPSQSSDPSTTLLLQVWDELFSAETPETFRCRYSHCGLLVTELRYVAGLACRDDKWSKHHAILQEELKLHIKNSENLLSEDPFLIAHLQSLCSEKSVSRTVWDCEVVEERIKGFAERALTRIRTINIEREKAMVIELLGIVGTDAVAHGIPMEYLAGISLDELSLKSSNDIINVIERLGRREREEYTCILFADGDLSDVRAILPGSQAVRASKSLLPTEASAAAQGLTLSTHHPVALTISADGPFQAAHEAYSRMRRVFDLFEFYTKQTSLTLSTLVYVRSGDTMRWVKVSLSSKEPIRQRKNARTLTQRFLTTVSLSELDGRVSSALDQFAVAQKAEDLRVRLIGVWSALESLTGGIEESSVFERVASVVVPAVVWRRTERIARYLAICLHQMGGGTLFNNDERTYFPNSNHQKVSCPEVLRALCAPKDTPAIRALLRISSSQPLLCQRVYRTWETFNDSKSLAKRLELSSQTIRWHMARIYRARNLIVHHGDGYRGLNVLVRHLEEYFAITLSRILHEYVACPRYKLDQIFAKISLDTNSILQLLERKPQAITVGAFVRPVDAIEDYPLYKRL